MWRVTSNSIQKREWYADTDKQIEERLVIDAITSIKHFPRLQKPGNCWIRLLSWDLIKKIAREILGPLFLYNEDEWHSCMYMRCMRINSFGSLTEYHYAVFRCWQHSEGGIIDNIKKHFINLFHLYSDIRWVHSLSRVTDIYFGNGGSMMLATQALVSSIPVEEEEEEDDSDNDDESIDGPHCRTCKMEEEWGCAYCGGCPECTTPIYEVCQSCHICDICREEGEENDCEVCGDTEEEDGGERGSDSEEGGSDSE